MSLSENDKRVLRLIKVGAENSITGAEISLTTKLTKGQCAILSAV